MPTRLTTKAPEKGTYLVTVAFTDEAGTAVTPDSITWRLTDENGAVVNSRSTVAISVPAASNTIILSGSDLTVNDPTNTRRKLSVYAVLDLVAGNDKPVRDEVEFEIDNFVSVS